MLVFDPNKRITVDDALAHPYFKDLHAPEDEPTTSLVSGFDFDFELYDLSNTEIKDMIYKEIMLYHESKRVEEYENDKKKYPDGMLEHVLKPERKKGTTSVDFE